MGIEKRIREAREEARKKKLGDTAYERYKQLKKEGVNQMRADKREKERAKVEKLRDKEREAQKEKSLKQKYDEIRDRYITA